MPSSAMICLYQSATAHHHQTKHTVQQYKCWSLWQLQYSEYHHDLHHDFEIASSPNLDFSDTWHHTLGGESPCPVCHTDWGSHLSHTPGHRLPWSHGTLNDQLRAHRRAMSTALFTWRSFPIVTLQSQAETLNSACCCYILRMERCYLVV